MIQFAAQYTNANGQTKWTDIKIAKSKNDITKFLTDFVKKNLIKIETVPLDGKYNPALGCYVNHT